ncbi:hypothetical protein Tco_0623153 [Tanacetum coccineum]
MISIGANVRLARALTLRYPCTLRYGSTCTPSTSSTNATEKEVLAGFADEVIYSLFAKQTEDLDLLHEDFAKVNRTFIVAHDQDVVESNVVVDKSLFHP